MTYAHGNGEFVIVWRLIRLPAALFRYTPCIGRHGVQKTRFQTPKKMTFLWIRIYFCRASFTKYDCMICWQNLSRTVTQVYQLFILMGTLLSIRKRKKHFVVGLLETFGNFLVESHLGSKTPIFHKSINRVTSSWTATNLVPHASYVQFWLQRSTVLQNGLAALNC